jgi:hypothetical protein
MFVNDLQADFSIKMLELEKAIDLGMPYSELKKIYNEIKALQYQIALTQQEAKPGVQQENNYIVIE